MEKAQRQAVIYDIRDIRSPVDSYDYSIDAIRPITEEPGLVDLVVWTFLMLPCILLDNLADLISKHKHKPNLNKDADKKYARD